MNLMQWDPFREMEQLLDRYGRARAPGRQKEGSQEILTTADWAPAVDISETDSEYLIKAELPEVNKEDVKVSVHEGVLTLQGERKLEKEEKDKKHHRVERFYGSFARSFTLPEDVDESSIDAEYKDGVLNLHLAKTEKPKPKSIEVKVK